ncbi:MAG: glycosyltransferase family 4 protein [Candidatus Sumerlaeota bacterium]|nr:glycosyltransferase family 4 protein [Candidatus Sumerlaeota bacterium]
MRICYLVADAGIPILGRKGCSTHVRETCRELASAGHEVTLFAANRGDDEYNLQGTDLRLIPPYARKWLGADLRMLLTARRMERALRLAFTRKPFDAVYERYSLYCRAGQSLARRFGRPRILEVNARLAMEQRARLHWPWLAQRCENRLLREADSLIVLTHPFKASLMTEMGLPDERIEVMPMAVDTNHFRPDVPARDLRGELGIRKDIVAGYIGTLTGWHGIDLFYDAARRLDAQGISCAIIIIGGDRLQVEEHRRRVAAEGLGDRLYFAGSVPYVETPSWINAMDVTLIASSTNTSSPTKLFEYHALGKPSVAPDLPPIREILTHGREGLLFAPGDVTGMVQCICQLIRHPEQRREMGARARARVVEEHSWEVNARRIVEMFEAMIEASRQAAAR